MFQILHPFRKLPVTRQPKYRLLIFHSTVSLSHKIPFRKILLTSFHMICALPPPNEKSWLRLRSSLSRILRFVETKFATNLIWILSLDGDLNFHHKILYLPKKNQFWFYESSLLSLIKVSSGFFQHHQN